MPDPQQQGATMPEQARSWLNLTAHADPGYWGRQAAPIISGLLEECSQLEADRGEQVMWEDVEIALRAALDDDQAVDAAMCLKNLGWTVRDA